MSKERHPNEGKVEKFARLSVAKHLGFFAVLAAGAVLLPPAAAVLAGTAAALEGAGAIASIAAHQHLKGKRLRKASHR